MIEAFKKNGWTAGKDWPKGKREWPHVQKTFGLTWSGLNNLRLSNQVDENGYVIIPGQ